MFRPFLPMLGAAALLLAGSAPAAVQTVPSQNAPGTHVWTNADLDRLRAEDSLKNPTQIPSQSTPQNAAGTHVWSNTDTDRLHNEDLISTFILGPAEEAEVNAPVSVVAASPEPAVRPGRLEDPEWYAEQAYKLNMQLELDQRALNNAQAALVDVKRGTTQPGIDLAEGNPGITPDAGIQNLEARVRDDEFQIDQLSDLARQHGILPGFLRN